MTEDKKTGTGMKTQEIPAIKNGTVLDHLPSSRVHKIVSILNLREEMTTIGVNLSSKRLGSKAIVKISDKFLDENEVNKISLLAPSATLNRIKDYKVVEKMRLKLEPTIEGIIRCSNPNCITNLNPVRTKFNLLAKNPVSAKCAFCERTMQGEEVDAHLI